VVEAHLDHLAQLFGQFDNRLDLCGIAASRLFHQHMLAGIERSQRDLWQKIVGQGDIDHIDVGRDDVVPILHGDAFNLRSEGIGARVIYVADDGHRPATLKRGIRAFAAD
jgi:hypothetical protein